MSNSLIHNFIPRLYQETIFGTVSQYNTLVVLPTGLGKTAIALMLVAHRLSQYPQSKCLLLAPTKPLVDQIWTEQGIEGDDNETLKRAKEAKTLEIRRLRYF